jgi:aspartate/methionine/tyrosine aminotransferase
MRERSGGLEAEVRLRVYESYRELFASAPIRLMSRTVSTMRAMGYPDLASAIGDLDWRTVPADDPEDPTLREEWGDLLRSAFGHVDGWLHQLTDQPYGYNLESVGYRGLNRAWAAMWRIQLGIEFEVSSRVSPQVFVFHGGNQAVQAALLGVAEAHRERLGAGAPCTVLAAIPTFSCPLDQMALQNMRVWLLQPSQPGMDPCAADLDRVPDGLDVDAIYLQPINNPTGRTIPPEQLRALIAGVLDRWPHAGVILDSVYVRLHPRYRELLTWFNDDPRFAESVMFVDSLSKSHGVTGLRAGAILTRAKRLTAGVNRYAQNILAGPSNVTQAVMLALLAPFALGDEELCERRIRLQTRIGRHLQRRRRLLLRQAFERHGELFDASQPVLPDPVDFDWEGSMYADIRLSDDCLELARRYNVSSPTVAFYLDTGVGGVSLDGFCRNPSLSRYGLAVNGDRPELLEYLEETRRYVRLSFGMTPPPRE